MSGTKRGLEDSQGSNAPKRGKLNLGYEEGQGLPRRATASTFSHNDYTVGWICALPLEMTAAIAMLDDIHPDLHNYPNDHNTYMLGKIGVHNVVVACLPSGVYGTTSAAAVANQMLSSFRSIRIGLMVGIGGGVPHEHADIRLGDVVVSKPTESFGGVVQYDYGKTVGEGGFKHTGTLNKPPQELLTAISKLQAYHRLKPSRIPEYLSEMVAKYPTMIPESSYPGRQQDRLFEAQYEHIDPEGACDNCDSSKLVTRSSRDGNDPVIHYGLIASGNQVMKHGGTRDKLAQQLGILCFEMEAAGLMDSFPCLIIRGICDYADSHKNKQWQRYAAATAAAYAKELLSVIPVSQITKTSTVVKISEEHKVAFSLRGLPLVNQFVPRDVEMSCLEEFFRPESLDPTSRKLFVIYGLGGIGKTQLAVEFARKHQRKFSAVFWLDGSSKDKLRQSFVDAAYRLPQGQLTANIPEALQQSKISADIIGKGVLQWLALPSNQRWLLIIDNVEYDHCWNERDSEAYDLKEYLPQADHGSILITSRLETLTRIGSGSFKLEKVNDQQAIAIIENNAGRPVHGLIIERLDGLPLALTQAGSYLRQTNMAASVYIKYYDEKWTDLMKKEARFPLQEYIDHSVLTTWAMSYEKVKNESEEAAGLLKLWGFLDREDVWYDLIACGSALETDNVPEWLKRLAENELDFYETLGLLSRYSLVDAKEEVSSHSIHPVLHKWCYHLANQREAEVLAWLAAGIVAEMVPDESEPEYWRLERRLLPHGNWVFQMIEKGGLEGFNGLQLALNACVCFRLGFLFSRQAKLDETEKMFQWALRGWEKEFGPEHTLTCLALNNLGIVYDDQGKLADSEMMLQRGAAGISEDARFREHTSRDRPIFRLIFPGRENALLLEHAATVNNLGNLYKRQGKLTEAERMYTQALQAKKVLGPEHKATLDTVTNMGNLYENQGRLAEAEQMYHQALQGYERTLGPEHISTLLVVNNLGTMYGKHGKLTEAEQMYHRALQGYEKTLGPEHKTTLDTVTNLGTLYKDRGKLAEAEQMYHRALRGYEKVLGPEHKATLDIVTDLWKLYENQGRLAEAEQMFRRVLRGYEEMLGFAV
ncbi:uncharacterized protein Z518_03583 [Rhinocladiella mackenziei CBS 650.93]|uniref:Nucleoside phosphorylase domain-containing protein n=1 Tax=Rhinocladiella mackenziei CBS 650.93 TaxID=1442369 RepID=A0A0D2IR23_9EURO|nr:uncharacterized protein Z518_03583 [Rhinocladiella mackenziei CBS 650.93]KIX05611.1 hypothetical protein Z518_03583 [Rhinocladiella mackenziei CBS 650.93]